METKTTLKIFLLTLIGILPNFYVVKAQFTLSGEIRPRTEFRHGFKKLVSEDTEPAFFTEQRSRLIANYKSEKLVLKISLQDVRIWGAASQVYKTDPALSNVNEAWAEYFFTPKLSLQVGRQELNYDNARILGNLGWAQQSRSHDLLKFVYADSLYAVHIGAAFNQDFSTFEFAKLTNTFYSGVNNYKTMQYFWYHRDLSNADFSVLFINRGLQAGIVDSSFTRFSQTYGANGKVKAMGLVFEGEFYYQGGIDAAKTDISAFMASLSATYKISGKTPITLGGDYLSGTEASDTKNKSFDPWFGTNHKFYGFMDYFYVGNPHGGVGLTDIYAKTAIKLGDKTKLLIHLHEFMSATDIIDPADASKTLSKTLGTEVDLVLNVNLSKSANFKVGYSQMFGTDSMEALKGGDKSELNNWAWAMLTFNPVFLSK